MFAQLGTVQFQATLAPEAMTIEQSASLPQLATVAGKPRIQQTGNQLRTIRLAMHLHYGFCNPDAERDTLSEACDNATPLPLLMGNGRFEGTYLIEKLNYSVMESFDDGTTIEARLDVDLVEYVDPDPATAAAKAAIKAGAGMAGNNPPRLLKPIAPQAPSTAYLASLNQANMQTNAVASDLAKAQANPNRIARALQTARKAAAKARAGMAAAERTLRQAQQLQNKAQSALAQARQAQRNIERMQRALEPPVDLQDALTATRAAQFSMTNVSSASAPLLNYSAGRLG